jgi:FMN phosphatase YigB (HAD superfamily)
LALPEPDDGPRDGGRRAYSGVLLDLFGTLVDFRSTFQSTLSRILSDHGLEDRAEAFQERWKKFVFQGDRDGVFMTVREDFTRSLERVLTDLGSEGDLAQYSVVVISNMFDSLRVADLFPEVREVVGSLDDGGIPWAVVSNVDEGDLTSLLEHHRLRPKVKVSSESVKAYKPDGLPFQMALEGLGIQAKDAIHVGDSPSADVAGAMAMALDVMWVNRYDIDYPSDLPRPRWESSDIRPLPGLLGNG